MLQAQVQTAATAAGTGSSTVFLTSDAPSWIPPDIVAMCGVPAFEPLWLSHTLSPCYSELAACAVLLLVLAASLAARSARLSAISQTLAQPGRSKKGTTGVEGLFICAPTFFLAMHTLHLTLTLWLDTLRPFEFHAVWHAGAAAAWLTCLIIYFRASRAHLAVDLRPFTLTYTAVLLLQIYTFFQIYGREGTFPTEYFKGSTWTTWVKI